LADSPDPGPGRVVACSALRRAYRDRIRARAGQVCFLFLKGDFELIAQRMRQRVGHYMQAGLLDSQFQTLETPGPEETDVITLNITEPVEVLVEQALAALKAHRSSLALYTPV
jgi:carbohydrate kinase (thermoresistant glucokinase family)